MDTDDDLKGKAVCYAAGLVGSLVEGYSREEIRGGLVWVTHKTHEEFKDETVNPEGGCGQFSKNGEWYVGYYFHDWFSQTYPKEADNAKDKDSVVVILSIGDDVIQARLELDDVMDLHGKLSANGFVCKLQSIKYTSSGGTA